MRGVGGGIISLPPLRQAADAAGVISYIQSAMTPGAALREIDEGP